MFGSVVEPHVFKQLYSKAQWFPVMCVHTSALAHLIHHVAAKAWARTQYWSFAETGAYGMPGRLRLYAQASAQPAERRSSLLQHGIEG